MVRKYRHARNRATVDLLSVTVAAKAHADNLMAQFRIMGQ